MTAAPHLTSGMDAEKFARQWLEARGLSFVDANFHSRFGELDLIMLDQMSLIIIEVRYRRSLRYGGPLGSVTPAKQKRIAMAAEYFRQRHNTLRNLPLRFDVLALSGLIDSPRVDWRQRAFSIDYEL